MKLIEPDHREAMCMQGMEPVADRDFSGAILMGIMSFSCSSGSSSSCESKRFTVPARMP